MNNSDYLISFDSTRLGYGQVELSNPFRLGIPAGVTVVAGENGSGKTTLGNIISKGRYAYGNRLNFKEFNSNVRMLSFTDIHSLSGMEVQYYHQRMEATMNDFVPTVGDIMGTKAELPLWKKLCGNLQLSDISNKKINYLSSGELRKLLLVNALLESPDILILDNPYIGLDKESREEFDKAMTTLRDDGISVIMLVCDFSEIPSYSDAVIVMHDLTLASLITDRHSIDSVRLSKPEINFDESLIPAPLISSDKEYNIAFSIRDGKIRYGDKEIFKNINWTIYKGERWALTGRNGSGKSLLLSLVCADNPQGYSNEITLFDRERGSGESIWEIKDAIGYVSPEVQLYFKSNSNVLEIIVQGLRNSLNRFRPATHEEKAIARSWMSILGILHLENRRFNQLSDGEQRIVLLIRAIIKQPALLVLDEPLHGLDMTRKAIVNRIIDKIVKNNGSSLIYVTHYSTELPNCVEKIMSI